MVVHRVWLAPLPYSSRTGRLLGAPSERQGQPSVVHGDRAGASEDEKLEPVSAYQRRHVHVLDLDCTPIAADVLTRT